MAEESLWQTLANAVGLGGDDSSSPREREMVMSPPPPKPTFTRQEGEDATAFSIRKRLKMREWENEIRAREDFPSDYMVPAAEAETVEESRYNRRSQIDEAVRAAEGR